MRSEPWSGGAFNAKLIILHILDVVGEMNWRQYLLVGA